MARSCTAAGAAVSKSDFATYTFALLALKDAAAKGAKLGGTVELHFTYDEESGGEIGPKRLLDEGLTQAGLRDCRRLFLCDRQRAQWLPAPRSDRRRQAGARGDSRKWRRRAGGGQRDPHGALCKPAVPCRKSVRTPGITSPTLNVGLINGGINTNVVPDQVTFRLDRRIIPEESPAEVEAGLRELISDSAKSFAGINVTVRQVLLATPLVPQPGSERIASAIQRHAQAILRDGCAGHRRAALHRRPSLCRARHSGGALWRGAADAAGSQRPQREREHPAVRPAGGHQDRRACGCGSLHETERSRRHDAGQEHLRQGARPGHAHPSRRRAARGA